MLFQFLTEASNDQIADQFRCDRFRRKLSA